MLDEEFRGPSFEQCLQGSVYAANKVCDFVATSYNGNTHYMYNGLSYRSSTSLLNIFPVLLEILYCRLFLQKPVKVYCTKFWRFYFCDLQQCSVHTTNMQSRHTFVVFYS